MSVTGVSSSSPFHPSITQSVQNKFQQIQSQFQQLGEDLQAGNLVAAQKDFATIQQDPQQLSGQVQHHHHHQRVRVAQESNSASEQQENPVSQAFGTLGQALQSGSLSSAQQAYTALQQNLQQFLPGAGATSSSNASVTSPTGRTVSLTA